MQDTGEGPFRSLQMTEAELNAFDCQGFWRLADLTLEAGFVGQNLDDASARLRRRAGHYDDVCFVPQQRETPRPGLAMPAGRALDGFAGEPVTVQAQRAVVSRRDPVRARCDPRETRCTGRGAGQHVNPSRPAILTTKPRRNSFPADALLR